MTLLIWLIIGCVVGVLLGLSGAGGAIVGVPLFVWLGGFTVKEATLYALYAVCFGAFLSWLMQRKFTQTRVSLTLALFSILGSYLGFAIKNHLDSLIITFLYLILCILSLYFLWTQKKEKLSLDQASAIKFPIVSLVLGGVFFGILATLTGLGGGILIVPFLVRQLKFSFSQAVATSLLSILLTACGSLWVQRENLKFEFLLVFVLFLGSVLSSLVVKRLIQNIPAQRLDQLRRGVLTSMIVLSMLSIVLSLMFRASSG